MSQCTYSWGCWCRRVFRCQRRWGHQERWSRVWGKCLSQTPSAKAAQGAGLLQSSPVWKSARSSPCSQQQWNLRGPHNHEVIKRKHLERRPVYNQNTNPNKYCNIVSFQVLNILLDSLFIWKWMQSLLGWNYINLCTGVTVKDPANTSSCFKEALTHDQGFDDKTLVNHCSWSPLYLPSNSPLEPNGSL